jgi:hypothetical protein
MFQTNVVEKIKTHFLLSIFFSFRENRAVYEIMRKDMVGARHAAADYDTAHARCLLDN